MREQGWTKKFMELLYEQNYRRAEYKQNPNNETQACYEEALNRLINFARSDGEVTDDPA